MSNQHFKPWALPLADQQCMGSFQHLVGSKRTPSMGIAPSYSGCIRPKSHSTFSPRHNQLRGARDSSISGGSSSSSSSSSSGTKVHHRQFASSFLVFAPIRCDSIDPLSVLLFLVCLGTLMHCSTSCSHINMRYI